MKKLLGIIVLGLLLSGNAYSQTLLGKMESERKNIFEKAADAINPLNYFKKKKKCQAQADRADTVAIGKNYYKHCMSRG